MQFLVAVCLTTEHVLTGNFAYLAQEGPVNCRHQYFSSGWPLLILIPILSRFSLCQQKILQGGERAVLAMSFRTLISLCFVNEPNASTVIGGSSTVANSSSPFSSSTLNTALLYAFLIDSRCQLQTAFFGKGNQRVKCRCSVGPHHTHSRAEAKLKVPTESP